MLILFSLLYFIMTWSVFFLSRRVKFVQHVTPKLKLRSHLAILQKENLIQQMKTPLKKIYEPRHEISNNVVCATSKAPDVFCHVNTCLWRTVVGLWLTFDEMAST